METSMLESLSKPGVNWGKLFFNLPDDSPIINAFIRLGTLSTEECSFMNSVLNPIAQFMCMAYDSEGPHSIPELRWKLWSKKNKEAENLPPTEATFIPLIQRTNIVGRVLKAYNDPNPVLPPVTE